MRSPNSWDPKTAVMEGILTLWSKTSEHYNTIRKMECTAWQYSEACGSWSSRTVVRRHIYRMNNCTQWSSVFTLVSRSKLMVQMVNTYLRGVDAQEARAGVERIDGKTRCGWSNPQRGVMACWMGVSRGNCNDYSKSNSSTRMELLLSTG